MKHSKRNILIICSPLLLAALFASCSSKGVQMPKHRMRRHCNCPTFSYMPQVETVFFTANLDETL